MGELRYGGLAMQGSSNVGSSDVGEQRCGGVSLWGIRIMRGLQWLPSLNSLRFRHFCSFPRNPQKNNYFKNSLRLNRLPQLIFQQLIVKVFFQRFFSCQNQSRPQSVPNSHKLPHGAPSENWKPIATLPYSKNRKSFRFRFFSDNIQPTSLLIDWSP